jgi:type IV pilus assembly protein PilB
MSEHHRIGDILLEMGLVTQEQLDEAMHDRGDSYMRLGEVLVAKGWLSEDGLLDALAEQYHLPVVDLGRTHPDPECVALVGLGYCLARLILPIYRKGDRLVCAVSDPLDNALFQALEDARGLRVEIMLASPSAIRAAIQRLVKGENKAA